MGQVTHHFSRASHIITPLRITCTLDQRGQEADNMISRLLRVSHRALRNKLQVVVAKNPQENIEFICLSLSRKQYVLRFVSSDSVVIKAHTHTCMGL